MKRLTDCSDEELVRVAETIVAKYIKSYHEAQSLAEEYGFEMGETETDIFDAVFFKLKERRDHVSKEDVEQIMKPAIEQLNKTGQFSKMSELLTLFNNEEYAEVMEQLRQLGVFNATNIQVNSNHRRTSYDYSKYKVNGHGQFPKGRVAEQVVRIFADKHPEMNSKDIVHVFRNVAFGNYDWYFITEQEYEGKRRSSSDSFFERRYLEVVIPSGERVYVSNQYNVQSITSFMNNVNRKNWGILIEKL